ncbi:MAG: LacI family DNA-binding transcriptional regulator [Planctomycetota bacterium]|jgi:LacI family transcriptional regulator|nr:LacI family DNA-binding transcriptional regulator [Planctomycetota bacterium]
MSAKKGNPSIKDVARVAGVSFKTVSRVLNRDPGVSGGLRARVERAVREVGYVANAGARAMRSGKSGVVGFISDVIATTPHSYEIVKGVQDGLAKRGFSMLIANTENDPAREAGQLSMFLENRVEGVIYASMYHREVTAPDLPAEVGLVMLNCFDSLSRYPAVVPDDEQIGRLAAEHLISIGHRKIAYMTLVKDIVATPLRAKGFRDAAKAAGIPATDARMRESVRRNARGEEISRAADMVKALFASADPPTAILAGNDPEAMRIVAALHRLKLRIPGDVSVLGIDDYRLICERLDPPLSSIGLPYREMGVRAVERLFGADPGAELVERMPGPLAVRESTAPPLRP